MRRLLAALLLPLATITTLAFAQPVFAVDFFGGLCSGAGKDSAACAGGSDKISGPNGIILKAANLLAIISGIAAVIMILIAGISMITAAGDSNKISSGKRTITYTVVGLVVIVLARTIVLFVVSRV